MRSQPMGWFITSATQTGTQHQQQGHTCQDHLHHHTQGGILAATLADGAGSATRGGEGARLAAQTMTRALSAQRPETPDETREVLEQAAEKTRRAIQMKAQEAGADIQEYHTTLLAVVHTGRILGTLQIGDGAIITASPRGDARLVHQPQQGRYPNETNFLTGSAFQSHTMISAQEAGDTDRVFLTSDGLQRLVLDYRPGTGPVPHQEFFRRLFGWLEGQTNCRKARQEMQGLLQSYKVTDKTQDDTSILAAVLKEDR